jgi:dTDP-4-amino-4,6-dideoxygalactose transaminase
MKFSKLISLLFSHDSDFEMRYIREFFFSNWITSGRLSVDAFENGLETLFKRLSLCWSLKATGTGSIHLGLILLGVKQEMV